MCPCRHFETPDGCVLAQPSSRGGTSTPGARPRTAAADAPVTQPATANPMMELLSEFKREIVAARTVTGGGAERSVMNTTTLMELPKGTPEALADLDSWLREFDRVVAHVSSNRGMTAADRIAHLLSCWGPDTDVGENMRMDQQTNE